MLRYAQVVAEKSPQSIEAQITQFASEKRTAPSHKRSGSPFPGGAAKVAFRGGDTAVARIPWVPKVVKAQASESPTGFAQTSRPHAVMPVPPMDDNWNRERARFEVQPAYDGAELIAEETQVAKLGGFFTKASGWSSDVTGTIEGAGTALDLGGDTSLAVETNFSGEVGYQWNNGLQAKVSYKGLDHSGHLNNRVTFHNRSYSQGTSIQQKNTVLECRGGS